MYGIPTTDACRYAFAFAHYLINHGFEYGPYLLQYLYSRCPV